jgi:hypothetical protein
VAWILRLRPPGIRLLGMETTTAPLREYWRGISVVIPEFRDVSTRHLARRRDSELAGISRGGGGQRTTSVTGRSHD